MMGREGERRKNRRMEDERKRGRRTEDDEIRSEEEGMIVKEEEYRGLGIEDRSDE